MIEERPFASRLIHRLIEEFVQGTSSKKSVSG